MVTFDPARHTVVPARGFADLRIGEVFNAPSRTVTDAHASAFQAVSADNHPIHYDAVYARAHGHVAPVVHGLQVLAFTAPGAGDRAQPAWGAGALRGAPLRIESLSPRARRALRPGVAARPPWGARGGLAAVGWLRTRTSREGL
ncbi:MaoC family dehydratase [Paractinoplanes atraurantiacus]|uniref:MaoC family dehydratase n=1 Tax=Paractinoplanes atraurantiacus TaxID=1036182 RepID=UPI001C540357